MTVAGRRSPARRGLVGAVIAALAVVCCAALPALLAVAGSIAVGLQVGLAGAVVAALVGVAVLGARAKARRTAAGSSGSGGA